MKNILVASCWMIITTGIVVVYSSHPLTVPVLCVAFILFTRTFINTILFDIRDIQGDKKHGTITLPVIIGIKKTKLFLYFYLTVLVLFTFFVTIRGILPPLVHIVTLSAIQPYTYIYLSDRKGVPMHTLCDVIADGEIIVMGVAAIIGKMLLG